MNMAQCAGAPSVDSAGSPQLIFGPVPSRRLGRSLGVNNIPPKRCSYSCVYCQLGPTREAEVLRQAFHSPDEIVRQVAERLATLKARGEPVDYVSFVPDGEPTLDLGLGESIERVRALGVPVAVISNASLIWHDEVRAALAQADWVSVKIDSVLPATWDRINRPHGVLRLSDILAGIRRFAASFGGTLVSETMLLEGINDGDADIDALGDFLSDTGIVRSYLAIPHRPPAVRGIRAADEAHVLRAWQALVARGLTVELLTGYEGDLASVSGDLREELLAITAVHPLRESSLRALAASVDGGSEIVRQLVDGGELRALRHDGEVFYLRALERVR